MKYEPRLPEHNHNVSHQRPGREFLSLAAAAVVLVLLVVWLSGVAVDWAVAKIDPATERQLLAQVSESIDWEDSGDAQLKQHVEALLEPLLACVEQPYAIQVVIKDDPAPNAFAVPGGQMWVTTGLLESGLSANGLSFVLGHELGHFANRDHLRGLGRNLVLWVLSRTLLGGSSGLDRLLSPSLLLGEAQHSQRRESQADITGLAALQCRYGHVGGATEFFETLEKIHPDSLPGLHYFESHPQLRVRIDSLRSQAREKSLVFEAVTDFDAADR
ncbi:MAG: M48 family metallopeptidase [Granulosicoccaceae bacterium]